MAKEKTVYFLKYKHCHKNPNYPNINIQLTAISHWNHKVLKNGRCYFNVHWKEQTLKKCQKKWGKKTALERICFKR